MFSECQLSFIQHARVDRLSWILFQLFTGAMVRDLINAIPAKHDVTVAKRSEIDDKTRKLSGIMSYARGDTFQITVCDRDAYYPIITIADRAYLQACRM